jgi:hypothetical protein
LKKNDCHSCYYETLERMNVRTDRLIKKFLELMTTVQVWFLLSKRPFHMQLLSLSQFILNDTTWRC